MTDENPTEHTDASPTDGINPFAHGIKRKSTSSKAP